MPALTQLRAFGAFTGKRYGSFAGRAPFIPPVTGLSGGDGGYKSYRSKEEPARQDLIPAPGGLLHKYKLQQAFKDKAERDAAVQKLPAISQPARAAVRKAAKAIIEQQPVDFEAMGALLNEQMAQAGQRANDAALEWVLYFLRVETHAAEVARRARADEDEMIAVLALFMEI